jgi:hypothetical protein
MGNDISVIIGPTIGILLLLILIITIIIYCYKHSHHNQSISKQNNSRHKHSQSISSINNDYHNNMTLLASPRRLAILELQQQFSYENSSCDLNELIDATTIRF